MAPRKFQKIEVESSSETRPESSSETRLEEQEAVTTAHDHTATDKPANYGEHRMQIISIPYGGSMRAVNATVNPAELQHGIAKQRADYAKVVAQHQEYRRVPKGKQVVRKERPVGDAEPDSPTFRTEH